MHGCPEVGQPIELVLDGGLGGSPALTLLGTGRASTPIGGGGTLLVSPLLPASFVVPLTPGGPGDGAFTVAATLPPSAAGLSPTLQAFVADPAAPLGFTATNGVEMAVP